MSTINIAPDISYIDNRRTSQGLLGIGKSHITVITTVYHSC